MTIRKIYWLLILVPITLALHYLVSSNGALIFILSALTLIPLAKLLSDSTEQISARCGPTLGGLLNVTFGNAGELVIGFFALQAGLTRLVKASLVGSILVNLLLTLGLSMLAAGMRKRTLKFNSLAARTRSTMLTLAAIALILPAGFSHLAGPDTRSRVTSLSMEFSCVLLVIYGLGLLFALGTHHQMLTPCSDEDPPTGPKLWPPVRAFTTLAIAAIFVGWMGEVLVGSIETASKSLGLTDVFIGLVVVAIAGNAAESTSAVSAALKDRLDLSVAIAMGSSIQVALFVAPVLVLLSHWFGPGPMDLVFTPVETVALGVTVVIAGQIASDGDSNWLEGALLLAVYLMLAVMFYYLPTA